MEELQERVFEYGQQALRELVEEGTTQPQVQLVRVDCGGDGGAGRTTCTLGFNRPPAPVLVAVEFTLQERDTPEETRRANVDEIKRAFNKKVHGT
jgi:hypothetical protein